MKYAQVDVFIQANQTAPIPSDIWKRGEETKSLGRTEDHGAYITCALDAINWSTGIKALRNNWNLM